MSILPKFNRVLAVLFALTISACATNLTSSVESANNADLDSFKTYAWISENPLFSSSAIAPEVINPLNENRIRLAIEQELQRKGYTKVAKEQADFVVAYTLGAQERVRVQEYYDDFGYHGYHPAFSRFGHGFGRVGNSVSVRTFTEGTLVVDVFENSHKAAVWHGSASKRLSRKNGTQTLIDEAVTILFSQFPDKGITLDEMPS